jgi:hypothetical protein
LNLQFSKFQNFPNLCWKKMSKRFLRNFCWQLGSPIVIGQCTNVIPTWISKCFSMSKACGSSTYSICGMFIHPLEYMELVECLVFSKRIRTSRNPMVMGRRSDQKDGKSLQLFMSHLVNADNKLETQHDSNYIRVWDIYNLMSCAQFFFWNINKFIRCFCACWHVGFFFC